MDRTQQLTAIAHAARTYGIHLSANPQGFIPADLAMDMQLAMDALPALVTVSNSGVPAFLTNYVDPKLIEVLVAPNKASEIFDEAKKGDWTTQTAFFTMIESTGEVSSYGDRNRNGEVGTNANWPQRQQYLYQTMTTWGDLEMARAGLAQIDWASQQSRASGTIMRQFENKMAFYGIAGLQNYGLLNDPALSAPISPNAKAAGGFTWLNNATYLEIVNDINKLYAKAVGQLNGILELTTPMKLCMSPTVSVALTYVATLGTGVSVWDTIKKTYPNMELVVAPQYSTGSGELVQLIVGSINGQVTGQIAFGEKMRAHGVVRDVSSFQEKKSAGGFGTVIYNPVAIAQMLGV